MKLLRARTRPPSQANPSPGLRNSAGENPIFCRGSISPSEPEDVLNLLPDRQRDEERQEDEPEQEEEEADPRAVHLTLVLDARTPLRARVRETAFDCQRVDRGVVRGTPMRGWGPDGERC